MPIRRMLCAMPLECSRNVRKGICIWSSDVVETGTKANAFEMTRVACAGADRIWATADNPRTEPQGNIFKDMRKGLAKGAKVSFVEDRRRAISLALDAAREKDTVLIAGKGHEDVSGSSVHRHSFR